MKAAVRAVEYVLPAQAVTTQDLDALFPEWSVQKIAAQTGIGERHIAAEGECASDLAVMAAEKLFASGVCQRESIDYCGRSTDHPICQRQKSSIVELFQQLKASKDCSIGDRSISRS